MKVPEVTKVNGELAILAFLISRKFTVNIGFSVNQTTLLSLPIGLKLRNFTFRFFVTGVSLRDRRKFFCPKFRLLISILIELNTMITNIIVLSRIHLKLSKLFTIFSTRPQYPIMSLFTCLLS